MCSNALSGKTKPVVSEQEGVCGVGCVFAKTLSLSERARGGSGARGDGLDHHASVRILGAARRGGVSGGNRECCRLGPGLGGGGRWIGGMRCPSSVCSKTTRHNKERVPAGKRQRLVFEWSQKVRGC